MNAVEQRYREIVDQLSPAQRVLRAAEMWNFARQWIVRQVREEYGDLPPEVERYYVAERLYGSDPKMRPLLEEYRGRVSPAKL